MLRRSLTCAVVVFGLLGAAPAWSECLSPSAEAGATTTTVYPCQEESATGGQQPVIVDTGKADSGNASVVERGSADVPWFEPKPTTTADPIGLPKAASENEKKQEPAAPQEAPKEEIVKIEPVPVEAPEKTEAEPTDAKTKLKVTEPEATEAEPAPAKAKTTRKKKVTKAKSAKTRVAKAKRTKVKLARTKRTKPKVAQDKPTTTKIKAVKAEPAEPKPEPAKTEPAKSDDKVIVMTKKDMSLGSRVKNWLGF